MRKRLTIHKLLSTLLSQLGAARELFHVVQDLTNPLRADAQSDQAKLFFERLGSLCSPLALRLLERVVQVQQQRLASA